VGTMKSVAGDTNWTGDSEEEPVKNIADRTAVAVAVEAPGPDSYTGPVAAAVAMIRV